MAETWLRYGEDSSRYVQKADCDRCCQDGGAKGSLWAADAENVLTVDEEVEEKTRACGCVYNKVCW